MNGKAIFTIKWDEKEGDKIVRKSKDSAPGQSGGDLWRELEVAARTNDNIIKGSFTLTAKRIKEDGTEQRAL